MPKNIFSIANILMALTYIVIGVLMIIYPESNFSKMMLPSPKWSYYAAALLIGYGLFRAYSMVKKLNEKDD